jgi:hypothetical protein
MKKNFKAVYVFEGEEYVIKTPVSLAKMLELYENVSGDFYTEPSADLLDELDSSYTYMADSVVELFVEDTGLVGDFEANFLLPSKKDEYGFRVVITRLEEFNYSYNEEEVTEDQGLNVIDKGVTLVGKNRDIIVIKNDKGNNIVHIKSLTKSVGKESAVKHFLSDDEEIKNSILSLSDEALLELLQTLTVYKDKVISN